MTAAEKPKRRWPRLAVTVKISGRYWSASGEGPAKFDGLMMHVSEGGAMVRTAAPVSVNGRIEFSFRLGLLERYTPKGTVRWWRRNGEVRELGVQFDDPLPRLGKFVEKELARLKA